jgi:diguanylate cyclase (GGDEF)-like protein
MKLLAITRHDSFVERLRMAFEGAGHTVAHLPDPLQALATEAWDEAHLILVDAESEPLDGYRFTRLLRGETRNLFHNLPLFVLSKKPLSAAQMRRMKEARADGYLLLDASIQRLIHRLGPLLEGAATRAKEGGAHILAIGMRADQVKRIESHIAHFGFQVNHAPYSEALPRVKEQRPDLLLLGSDAGGSRALSTLETLAAKGPLPYTLLVGAVHEEAMQRSLLHAGLQDWIQPPLSGPRLLHALRRGLEWKRVRRIQAEYETMVHDLQERRRMLEIEASALRTEVLTDPLTGLLNRRSFDQNLESQINTWARHKRPFVLILCDVDHFKLVNDRFGHPAGDAVLQGLADRIRTSLRRSDLAFRIGGEEFALILPETGLASGAEVAEKLRKRIDGDPLELPSGQPVFPSMSFGVGVPESPIVDELVGRVDMALYAAKQSGRNQVKLAEAE